MGKRMNWGELRSKAVQIMVEWLSHENELGKAPAAIEVAEEFDYENGHVYVIRYKENEDSDWWLGVSMLDEEGEDCGLNFSDFDPYEPETAKDKSLQMIEYLQEYYRNRAKEYLAQYGVTKEEFDNMTEEEWEKLREEKDSQRSSTCQSFVLLGKPEFDFDALIQALNNEWNMEIEEYEVEDGNLVLTHEDNLFGVSLIEAPIPEEEITYAAQGSYMWKGAMDAAQKHTAQLLVFSMNREHDSIEAARCLSKVVSACVNQENALGIYSVGTIYAPEFYKKVAESMKEGELPIPIWVYVGLGRGESGNDGFTVGLCTFDIMELEIINSKHSFDEIWEFFMAVCDYLLKSGLRFTDGEVLKFASNMNYLVTRTEAVYDDGEVFRIGF